MKAVPCHLFLFLSLAFVAPSGSAAQEQLLCPAAAHKCIGSPEIRAFLSNPNTNKPLPRLEKADLDDSYIPEFNLEQDAACRKKGASLVFTRACIRNSFWESACLKDADFKLSNLANTYFTGALFDRADLSGSCLRKAHLNRAVLNGANLYGSDLTQAYLSFADLNKANLQDAMLARAILFHATLTGANLTNANLCEASLVGADLEGALLIGTTIDRSTDLSQANLSGAVLEPRGELEPALIATAKGLRDLRFTKDPRFLIQLADALKKSGFDQAARDVVCAIERSRSDGPETSTIEKIARLVAFDFTYNYGAEPHRPLVLILSLVILSSVIYAGFIFFSESIREGIWLSPHLEPGKNKPIRAFLIHRRLRTLSSASTPNWVQRYVLAPVTLRLRLGNVVRPMALLTTALRWGFYFSMISAFRLGQKFDLGSYAMILLRRDFALNANGWIRTVAGIQSLLVLYLAALWVFAVFGVVFGLG